MATTQDWTEYAAATTAQSLSVTSTISEVGNDTYTDYYASINSANRLLNRTVTSFTNAGNTKLITISHYTFETSGDATYTPDQKTTPFTNAEADSVQTYQFPNALPIADLYADAGV